LNFFCKALVKLDRLNRYNSTDPRDGEIQSSRRGSGELIFSTPNPKPDGLNVDRQSR